MPETMSIMLQVWNFPTNLSCAVICHWLFNILPLYNTLFDLVQCLAQMPSEWAMRSWVLLWPTLFLSCLSQTANPSKRSAGSTLFPHLRSFSYWSSLCSWQPLLRQFLYSLCLWWFLPWVRGYSLHCMKCSSKMHRELWLYFVTLSKSYHLTKYILLCWTLSANWWQIMYFIKSLAYQIE